MCNTIQRAPLVAPHIDLYIEPVFKLSEYARNGLAQLQIFCKAPFVPHCVVFTAVSQNLYFIISVFYKKVYGK